MSILLNLRNSCLGLLHICQWKGFEPAMSDLMRRIVVQEGPVLLVTDRLNHAACIRGLKTCGSF